jgi:hypothetical protein
LRTGDGVNNMINIKKLEDQIGKLSDEITNNSIQAKNRYDSLAESKREMENSYEERIKHLQEQQ